MQALAKCLHRAILFAILAVSSAFAQSTYEYDALGRVTRVIDTRVGFDQTYAYDAAGNRVSVVSTVPPSFSISDVTITEGGSAVFTVTKTGTASQSHSVSFATANGTAVSGTPPAGDYTAQNNTISCGRCNQNHHGRHDGRYDRRKRGELFRQSEQPDGRGDHLRQPRRRDNQR